MSSILGALSKSNFFLEMKRSLLLALTLVVMGCSQSDMLDVRLVFISVDKDIALDERDQIVITAEVKDNDLNLIEGAAVQYFVDGAALNGNIFRPDKRGNYILSAEYQGVESNRVEVRVINVEQDVESINLIYDGYRYLTTNEWSISGNFSFEAVIDNKAFPLTAPEVQLFLQEEEVEERGQFHFLEAGRYDFQASFSGFESNTVSVEVRAQKKFDEVVIPVIFHVYGVEPTSTQIRRLVDTLNNSFSKSIYLREEVINGLVNPNAVNCFIRFELAASPPEGREMQSPGLHIIASPNNEFPLLSQAAFTELENEHLWDPDQFINIWLAEGYDFDFPPVNSNDEFGSGGARGLVYSPFLLEGTLPGLFTIGLNDKGPSPDGLSPSILLNSGSVLGEHPDYIVNRVGYFLGLFNIGAAGCQLSGDYCPDTFAPDFRIPNAPDNSFPSCEGPYFLPSNHMSFFRNYTNFTYDQRERMRLVLTNGFLRPKAL